MMSASLAVLKAHYTAGVSSKPHDEGVVGLAVDNPNRRSHGVRPMLNINELNAHAERVAQKLGVLAGVALVNLERFDVEPGGERIKLSVFRGSGVGPQSVTFAPDTPDLKARIEQEIPRLAALLPITAKP